MAEQRIVGKAQTLLYGGATLYITKAAPKATRKLADTTDTGDYDAATDLVYPSQLAASVKTEFSVEGRYRKDSTPTALIAKLFDGAAGALTVAWSPTSGLSHFGGKYDLSDFSIDSQTEETVTWSGTLVSNGKINPNS